jgi:DNA repair exonuclease SbcCD ATPase subunit
MPHQIVKKLTPEEEELAAKREELARLEAQLADQELLLASLKAELAAFEGLYLRRVGVLYAELDEWNARLAELRAEQAGTPQAKAEAAEARTQAEEAYSAAHGEAAEVQPFTPSPELKKLYREAAKRVHPDTATDEKDRARRERLMKEVNAAYAAGDEDALRRILANLDASPDAVQGSGIGADLIRVLRQLKQIRDRIAAIEQELSKLRTSEIAQLRQDVDKAEKEGRDLLAELAASVLARIADEKKKHDGLTVELKKHGR